MGHDRRPMFSKQGLQARNTQAAKDALRRRQKEKKARIVKRHVRYKEKKKLIEQLEANAAMEPIVAEELASRWEGEEAAAPKAQKTKSNKRRGKQDTQSEAPEQKGERPDEESDKEKVGHESDDAKESKESVKRKKYAPFTKQIKEYEKTKKEREAQEKERQNRIKEREEMLARSKKDRSKKAKQFRKVTSKGQPMLKYKMDAMLSRLQKQ